MLKQFSIRNSFLIIAICSMALSMCGCSDNIRKYQVNANMSNTALSQSFAPIKLEKLEMPKGDGKSFLCRLNSNVSLPYKMTISDYLTDAVKQNIILMNKGKDVSGNTRDVKITVNDVSMNTLLAKWTISADIQVDNNNPVFIESVTDHNFSYVAMSACKNAANAFDEAVEDFVQKIFSDKTIVTQLKR